MESVIKASRGIKYLARGVLGEIESRLDDLSYCVIGAGIFASSFFFYPSLLINLLPMILLFAWSKGVPSVSFVGLPLLPLLCGGGGGDLSYLFIGFLVIFPLYPGLVHLSSTKTKDLGCNKTVPDWWWVFFGAVGVGSTVFFNTLRLHYNFQTGIWDLGVLDNVFFNIISGRGAETGLPQCHSGFRWIGNQNSYVYFLLAPFYFLLPSATTLLFISGLSVVASTLSVFLFGRAAGLGRYAAVSFSFIWALYVPTQGGALFQFHETSIAPIFLFLCGWAMFSHRRVLSAVFFLLVLSCGEDYPSSWSMIFPLLGWWTGRKADGILMFLGCGFYVMSMFLLSEDSQNSTSGILSLAVINPGGMASSLWNEGNLQGVLELLLPLAILPMHTFAGAFLTIWACGLHYTQGNDAVDVNRIHSAYILAVPVFIGALYSLGRLRSDRRDAWVSLAISGAVLSQFLWGMANPINTIRSGGDVLKIPHLDTDKKSRYEEFLSVTQTIPADAVVMASNTIVPHLSSRKSIYCYETCLDAESGLLQDQISKSTLGVSSDSPDYIILWRGADQLSTLSKKYKKYKESEHFQIWKRGFLGSLDKGAQ